MSPLLSFRNVWVEYGDKIVLERVSLDIDEGSFVSVVGASGVKRRSKGTPYRRRRGTPFSDMMPVS